MSTDIKVKIKPAKGRPMLIWVGKRPLSHVTAFPGQHIESFAPIQTTIRDQQSEIWNDWPAVYPKGGLLFHGDNKEVLANLLANGFRGKVDLIYIDPPFDSGADYVRRVKLRGVKGTAKLEGEGYTLGEQIQYTDIWANDNYLQFMYERLLLLKELLAEDSSIWLHCDWHKDYHLRCLLDEVFGAETFKNEVVWYYYNKLASGTTRFSRAHDILYCYVSGSPKFNSQEEQREKPVKQIKRKYQKGIAINVKDEEGRVLYRQRDVRRVDDVWRIACLQPADQTENTGFCTQKPEKLLERIILSYTKPGDIVLDGFIGAGTTAAVAQKLGRRWIGCDINKVAIQTASKRLQTVILEQIRVQKKNRAQPAFPLTEEGGSDVPAQYSFDIYRVNDYDLQMQHNEAVNLACEHIGITRSRTDVFFDGTLGKKSVKITPFNHPLTQLDLEEIKKELAARPEEERDIIVVCLGKEIAVDGWLENWNRLRKQGDVPNKVEVIELRSDPKYGQFFVHQPARARVSIKRVNGKVKVTVQDFISPTIIERLKQQAGILSPQIDDWRAMVDSVMIDVAYNQQVFDIALSDVPQKKKDLVVGEYELDAPKAKTTVAVKITDMLGEEVLVTKSV
jgi:DNA modification methylase